MTEIIVLVLRLETAWKRDDNIKIAAVPEAKYMLEMNTAEHTQSVAESKVVDGVDLKFCFWKPHLEAAFSSFC